MGERTKIGWTDATFNAWWGCEKVSEGCKFCYAEILAARFETNMWGPNGFRKFFGEAHWQKPLLWNRKAQKSGVPTKVFCASMSDFLEARTELDAVRKQTLDLIEKTPWLIWQVLTKRPENISKLLPEILPPNLWLGTTAENQKRWDERVHILMQSAARIKFVSAEPLLGPIVFPKTEIPDWIIVGGESGRTPRPMDAAWVTSLRDQCRLHGVPFFFKQWGGTNKLLAGNLLEGEIWEEFPKI